MLSAFARVIVGSTLPALLGGFVAGCSSNSSSSPPPPVVSPNTSLGPAQPAAMSVPGVQRTASAVDGLHAVTIELSTARQATGDTLQALQALSSPSGDLRAPFQQFITLRAQLEQDDKQIASRAEDMRTRARDYITNWEVEVYGVEDKALREQAEQRRNLVRENYGRITDAMRSLREAFDPFRRELQDIQTFLANDLTSAGVQAAAPSIQRADQLGKDVQHRIDTAIAELQRVASAMTPAVTQPTTADVPAPR